jgi:transposase
MVPGKERHKLKPVADRWHRLSNLSEAMKGFFLNKQAQLKALVQKPSENLSEEEAEQLAPWQTGLRKYREGKSLQFHQERVARDAQIQELHDKKVDVATIARQVKMSRQMAYRSLHLKQPPERPHIHQAHQPILEPYKDSLVRRCNEGCRNARTLHFGKEKRWDILALIAIVCGSLGTCASISTSPGPIKQVDPATQTPVQTPPKRPPSASQVAHWITLKEEQRLDWQQKYLTQLCEADQEIQEAHELVIDFTSMLRERQGERLDAWLEKVEIQSRGELKNFAQGLKRDYDAVKAGLMLEWSNGHTSVQPVPLPTPQRK